MAFPLDAIRREFPSIVHTPDVAYLDGAATTQTPACVLKSMSDWYAQMHANVHRGFHGPAEDTTRAYEHARKTVAAFMGATESNEVVFTKNATEAINLVARSYGMAVLQAGDAIALSVAEHHSNIIPWQQICALTRAHIRWVPVGGDGMPTADALAPICADRKVRIVCITGQSNVLGTRPILEPLVQMAHAHGAVVMLDAAQLAAHAPLHVTQWDVDFVALSGHKIYGPTGIGVLYGKRELLASMPPFLGGGSMATSVSMDGFDAMDAPHCFEAGTPPIAEAIGLAASLEWQKTIPWDERIARERVLMECLYETLQQSTGVEMLGRADQHNRFGCVSFSLAGVHPHDVAEILWQHGLCVRAGLHCAGPLHAHLGLGGSTRVSVSLHTTEEDIARLQPAIEHATTLLRG